MHPVDPTIRGISSIDFQKIHFARHQGGDYTVVYLRPITPRNYFSENLYENPPFGKYASMRQLSFPCFDMIEFVDLVGFAIGYDFYHDSPFFQFLETGVHGFGRGIPDFQKVFDGKCCSGIHQTAAEKIERNGLG
jgi:hypothetical protein